MPKDKISKGEKSQDEMTEDEMSKRFPFKKNKYQNGFPINETTSKREQRYWSNKHQFINRLLNIEGVIYGLQVESDDDTGYTQRPGLCVTISPGCAIDKYGQAIVVTSTNNDDVQIDLSTLEVFKSGNTLREYRQSDDSNSKYFYLMIAYDEDSTKEKQVIQDDYKFCLMPEDIAIMESKANTESPISITPITGLDSKVESNVIITQYFPKYIDEYSLRERGIAVWMNAYLLPNSDNKKTVEVSYTLELSGYKAIHGGNFIKKSCFWRNHRALLYFCSRIHG